MKIKLFTHTDLDGVGCAVLGEVINRNKISIDYCKYDDINQKVESFINSDDYNKYDKVFITDLSVNMDVANKIDKLENNKFKLFDHHKTALELNKFEWVNVVIEINNKPTCGTELFWNFINSEYLSNSTDNDNVRKNCYLFAELVRLYDTWSWKDSIYFGNTAVKLNELLYIYTRHFFIKDMVDKIILSENGEFISDTDKKILEMSEMKKKKIFTIKENKMVTTIYEDYKVGVIFSEEYISELADYILFKYNDIDFVAIVKLDNGTVSLRSRLVDVSEIAKKYGGGGHKNSSGFIMGDKLINKIANNIFN